MKRFLSPLLITALVIFAGCDATQVDDSIESAPVAQDGLLRFNTTSSAKAAASNYAIAVPYALQGTRGTGGAILPERTDPNSMLGAPDGNFFSLGFDKQSTSDREGVAILDFSNGMLLNALTVTLQEITVDVNAGNPYPEEKVDVYVSSDMVNWTQIGTGTNAGPRPTTTSVLPAGVNACVRYVKLVDVTDLTGYSSQRKELADGFDVDAVSIESNGECSTDVCTDSNDLLAGQHDDVGDVVIERLSDTQIRVTFTLQVDGEITDTYVHVGDEYSDIPQNKNGNMISGQFEYKTEGHTPGTTEVSYVVDVSAFDPAAQLYVAAHANVNYMWNGTYKTGETAWGDGEKKGKNWFTVMLFDCE